MALQGTVLGNRIGLKNGLAADAPPKRLYELDTTAGQFKAVAASGSVIGVLLEDKSYVDSSGNPVCPDGKMGSLQIDGIVDIDCYGLVTVGDYVKAYTAGKVVSAGVLSGMSSISVPFVVVGRAMETGTDATIAVLLRPQVLPKTT
jgi:hypothetical protein